MATKTEVAMVLSRLAAGFPEVTISPEMVRAWCEDFAEIPAEHMLAAALESRRTSRNYFPRIGEIRERADELWTRAAEEARSRTLRLEEPRSDPDDPAVLASRAQLARLTSRIKTVDGGPPATEAENRAREAQVRRAERE